MPKIGQQEVGSPWKEGEVSIFLDTKEYRKIKAQVYGCLAVHLSLEKTVLAKWVVTSTTTGLAVSIINSEEDAKRISEVLWSKACLGFREKTKSGIVLKTPGWVRKWLGACRQASEYVDYQPFVEAAEKKIKEGGS